MNPAFKRKGCGPQALGSAVKLATPLKISCWKGCEPKPGTPKTKKSPTKPGERVNNCDCP